MKILLLGGCGFIGRSLSQRLSEYGHEVVVIDHNVTSPIPPGVSYHVAAIDDRALLRSLLSDCSHLFHLASATTPGSSRLTPSSELLQNLLPTVNLLEVLYDFPKLCSVYVSSGGAVYGNSAHDLVTTSELPSPISYYGAGKAAVEIFLQVHQRNSGSRVTVLRPANLYGPGQVPRGGFGVVPTLLDCARSGNAFNLWGDGHIVRDFLFIDDFTELCLKLIERPPGPASFEMFNVGSGAGCSIRQLIEIVEAVTGQAIEVISHQARGIDVQRIVLDSSALVNSLQWQPRVELEQGLRQTWAWVQKLSDTIPS